MASLKKDHQSYFNVVEKEKSISLSEVECIVCWFPIGGAEYILQYSIFSVLYCKMWFDAILPEIWRKYVYEIEAMRVAISLPCKWKMWSIEPQSEIFPKLLRTAPSTAKGVPLQLRYWRARLSSKIFQLTLLGSIAQLVERLTSLSKF